jgi:hypothetical protein
VTCGGVGWVRSGGEKAAEEGKSIDVYNQGQRFVGSPLESLTIAVFQVCFGVRCKLIGQRHGGAH